MGQYQQLLELRAARVAKLEAKVRPGARWPPQAVRHGAQVREAAMGGGGSWGREHLETGSVTGSSTTVSHEITA